MATRTAVLVLLFAAALPGRGYAQGAECATVECARSPQATDPAPAARQWWQDAGNAHQIKLRFVDALRQFAEAQAGTFGDEGPALVASLEAMRAALTQWDAAIQRLETALRGERAVEARLVLGTVYLDRHRGVDAARELAAAARLDASRPDVYAALALAHAMSGRPDEAARSLRTAVSLDPNDAALAYTLARRASEANRTDEAVQALRRFIRLRAAAAPRPGVNAAAGAREPPPAPFDRAELFRQQAGVAPIFPVERYAAAFGLLDDGDYVSAVEQLARAVDADPLTQGDPASSASRRRGAALLREGQVPAAINVLAPLAADPQAGSEAHRIFALAAWVAGDHNTAIAQLRLAVPLASDDDRARLDLAFVLRASDRPSEAERELRDAAAALPRSGQPRYMLGQLLESQSLLTAAADAFEESGARAPIVGRDRLYQKLGGVRANQADFDGAIAAYVRRVDVNPNGAEGHRSLGEIYFLEGRDDEGLAEFAVASWLDPADARALAAAGQVHLRAQRYNEAAAALTRAVELDGARKEARYALGQALARLGRVEDGRRELEAFQRLQDEALARGQRDFQVEQMRAEAARHLAAGAPERALVLLQQVAEQGQDTARALRDLGSALLRARRVAEAIESAEAALRLDPTADGYGLLAEAYSAAGRTDESRQQRAHADLGVWRARLARLRDLDSGQ